MPQYARKLWIALPMVLALSLVAAACGDDDDDDDDAGSPTATTAAATTTSTTVAAAEINDVAVTAADFSFDAPASIPAGLSTLTLENTGAESHQAQLLLLNDGVTPADFAAAAQDSEEAVFALVSFAGGPGPAAPEGGSQATVDLEAGQYMMVCFIPSPDGVPHIAKGMVRPLEVTPSTGPAATPPEADAEVTLKDFAFDAPATIDAGKTTIAVTNAGPQPHEMGVVKLSEGVTPEQVQAIFSAPPGAEAPAGPPPFTDAGGFQAIVPGGEGWATVDFEAGATYALVCFVPDAASGAPHVALGMLGFIEVN